MRIRSIDWLRGLVMMLMTVDHAGGKFDAAHMHADSFLHWARGSALPAGEFLTRWVTHLCAPTFLLLAGISLALSAEKRRDQPGQTRFIVTRGLLIAALDPLWMSLAFNGYHRFGFQVLYAIGISMVCMAYLRHLPSRVLLAAAVLIQVLGEFSSRWHPEVEPIATIWKLSWSGGPVFGRGMCVYPFIPWLSIMMIGWVVGRWLVVPRPRGERARTLAVIGVALLAMFVAVRGHDGYGNWHLHRDSLDILQWLHVNKYPPSFTYVTLELGLAFLLLAGFMRIDDPEQPRAALRPLALFGATAFFFYLLHVHLLAALASLLDLDASSYALAKTWLFAALVIALLAAPCAWYRGYKRAHPDGWARYI
ncbi:MAG: DUF1624 domain-containing protein [Acidobacteriota bacterium]